MSAPRPWTVLRHDPIVELEANLWCVEADLPVSAVRRRMSIVRRSDGGLLFHNAVPLSEEAMRRIEAFGRPALLVVPNGLHRLDIHAFTARYPSLRVHCPVQAHRRVSGRVPVDGHWSDLPPDPTSGPSRSRAPASARPPWWCGAARGPASSSATR